MLRVLHIAPGIDGGGVGALFIIICHTWIYRMFMWKYSSETMDTDNFCMTALTHWAFRYTM